MGPHDTPVSALQAAKQHIQTRGHWALLKEWEQVRDECGVEMNCRSAAPGATEELNRAEDGAPTTGGVFNIPSWPGGNFGNFYKP